MKGKIKTLIRLDSLLNTGGGGGADTVTYIHLMRHYFNYCSHSLDMPLTLCLCLQVRVCVCVFALRCCANGCVSFQEMLLSASAGS